MSNKCEIKQKGNVVKVKFDLTLGESLALKHALEEYSSKSPVGGDVCCYLSNAWIREGIDVGK